MATTDKNTLKSWFVRAAKPLASQFAAWMDSYWHKSESIPTYNILYLDQTLAQKVNKKDLAQSSVAVYNAANSYTAGNVYVSYVNAQSQDVQFQSEAIYRCVSNASAGQSPETQPAKWLYQGTNLGEISIDDVVDLRGTLAAKASTSHIHAQSDVTGLVTALSGKSDTGHTHSESDVTGLTNDLAGKKVYHGIEQAGIPTFNSSTHVLTLPLSSGHVIYWNKGVKKDSTNAITCDLNNFVTLTANTLYWFYFDDASGTLKAKEAIPNFYTENMVATVYWNGSIGAVNIELHNHTRNIDFHIHTHLTQGTKYYSGLAQTYPTLAQSASLQIETGVLRDEDQSFTTGQSTTMRGWYKVSANKMTFANYALPYVGTSGQPKYLRTSDYSLQNVGASNYVCMWVYGTLDPERPIQIVPTHATSDYNTIALAKAETNPVLSALSLNPEWKLLFRWIFKGDGTYEASGFIDYRTEQGAQYGNVGAVNASSVSYSDTSALGATNVQGIVDLLAARYKVVEYEIAFPAVALAFGINANAAITLNQLDKGAAINQVSYSTDNGVTWTVPTLTLVSGNLYSFNTPLSVSAGTYLKFRIDSFQNGYSDGTLILKGTK